MKTKNLMVSFCAVIVALVLAMTFVMAGSLTSTQPTVTIEGIDAYTNTVSVVAGEMITVKVYFTALEDDTDVTVEAELEGEKIETEAMTDVFDVEQGKTYRKVLNLRVPFELKDEISNDLTLSIEVDGKLHKTDLDEITVRVQRPSYNPVVKSITTSSSVEAGKNFPIEIVLKNMGYNDLDDIYVTAKISELGLSVGPTWFGDLVSLEDCDDDCDKEDTVVGRLYLKAPYNAKAGVYNLEVVVYNDDAKTTEVKQIIVENDFSSEVITTSSQKSASEGEDVVYEILLVNPTDNVKVYRVISEDFGESYY